VGGLFHVDGIENSIDQFSRLDTVLKGKEILQIFQIAGDAVAERAQSIVDVRTGRTQRAIFARAYRRDSVPYVLVGVETHEPGYGHEVVPYAGHLEYGTIHMEAHPYVREAAAQMEATLLDSVGTAIAALLSL
jgi:HK97 gp10 family phage protein